MCNSYSYSHSHSNSAPCFISEPSTSHPPASTLPNQRQEVASGHQQGQVEKTHGQQELGCYS